MKLRYTSVIYCLLITLIAALPTWNSLPARSQDPTTQIIESNEPAVIRIGNWTSQTALQASGGSYLYSGGVDSDALTLQFSGPSIEVIFVTGPSLGTLVINVDDIVLRTVITTAETTAYMQSSRIDYLSDEPHTLKVYAQAGGVVAIDAFVVPTSPPTDETTASGQPRDGLGSGDWMATYVQRFPPSATCSIPNLNLSSLPSGSMVRGTYPVSEINFDWGNNSGPAYVAPTTDQFGISFARTVTFAEDTIITISFSVDDGIRIYDNGVRFVNSWGCGSGTPMLVTHTFTAGVHDLEVQYVENTGTARVIVAFSNPLLSAIPQLDGSVSLAWTDILTGETNYRVERSLDGVSNWGEIATVTAPATNYVDATALCNTTYHYRVRGYFSGTDSYSVYSNVASATTSGCVSGLPTSLIAQVVDYTQMQLTWVDNAADETEYRIEMSSNGISSWNLIGTAAANATTYTYGNLDCSRIYYYRIRAYRSGDGAFSDYSNVASANTVSCFIIGPINLTTTALDDGRIQLDWTDYADEETEFRIERSPNGTNGWVEIGSAPANTVTYTNVSLSCGTTYHYRVRAYRAAFATYSPYTNIANATTAACPANCDTVQKRIQRLTVAMDGGAPNGNVWTGARSLSDDGRYAVFSSHADNLVPVETNTSEVYLFDRVTCQTTLIFTPTSGPLSNPLGWSPSISGDGRYILYEFDGSDLDPYDVNLFLHDRQTGTTVMVSQAIDNPTINNGFWGMLSGNGRYVAFVSPVALIPSDTNTGADVYVRDLQSNTFEIASLTSTGAPAGSSSERPYISYDGRYVTFISSANLVPEDTNNIFDVYLRDMVNDTVTLVSYGDDETVHGVRSEMPHPNTFAWVIYAPVTPDGRYVAFVSSTPGMTANNTNEPSQGSMSRVYLRDVLNGTTTLVSVDANNNSFIPSISDDGRYIVFSSDANNFVVGDTNHNTDVYMYDRLTASISWLSQTFDGDVPNFESAGPYITPDGRYVSFYSGANNLVSEGVYPGMALVERSLLFAPGSFLASADGRRAITLNWSDANADENEFSIEQSLDGTSWSVIATLPANTTTYTNVSLICGTTYHYRVRAYRSADGSFSDYSNVATATTAACLPDALTLVNPATRSANLLETLNNPPAPTDYTLFATGFPHGTGGRYITGDWNGDGLDTLGVYWNGAFFFTNDYGTGGTWGGVWFGLGGQPVVGRFDANVNHDCLGVTDSGTWVNGDTYFALYFTCNLTSGPTPPLTFQWLSILLPNSQGFTGIHQFVAGDFDGDGVDSVAVRRGGFIAWTNIPPTTLLSQFNLAQYIGTPGTGDEGKVVVGDWDLNQVDSFGLVYQNGMFYRRNDVEWNSGVYILQQFTPMVGTPFDVASWQPN